MEELSPEAKAALGVSELAILREMVLRWKASYCKLAEEDGSGEVAAEDYQEEIQRMVLPYLIRLHQTSYLNQARLNEFLMFCDQQVADVCNSTSEEG